MTMNLDIAGSAPGLPARIDRQHAESRLERWKFEMEQAMLALAQKKSAPLPGATPSSAPESDATGPAQAADGADDRARSAPQPLQPIAPFAAPTGIVVRPSIVGIPAAVELAPTAGRSEPTAPRASYAAQQAADLMPLVAPAVASVTARSTLTPVPAISATTTTVNAAPASGRAVSDRAAGTLPRLAGVAYAAMRMPDAVPQTASSAAMAPPGTAAPAAPTEAGVVGSAMAGLSTTEPAEAPLVAIVNAVTDASTAPLAVAHPSTAPAFAGDAGTTTPIIVTDAGTTPIVVMNAIAALATGTDAIAMSAIAGNSAAIPLATTNLPARMEEGMSLLAKASGPAPGVSQPATVPAVATPAAVSGSAAPPQASPATLSSGQSGNPQQAAVSAPMPTAAWPAPVPATEAGALARPVAAVQRTVAASAIVQSSGGRALAGLSMAGMAMPPDSGELAQEAALPEEQAAPESGKPSASELYGEPFEEKLMHLYRGPEGVQAWIRDAELSAAQARGLAQALASELGGDGVRLASLTVNGRKVSTAATDGGEDEFMQQDNEQAGATALRSTAHGITTKENV